MAGIREQAERAARGSGDTLGNVEADLRVGGVPCGHVRRVMLEEELSGWAAARVVIQGGLDLDPGLLADVVGRSAQLTISRADGSDSQRRFCGIVRRIEQTWRIGGRPAFAIQLEPAFAALDDQPVTQPFVRRSAVEILRHLLIAALAKLDHRRVDFRLARRVREAASVDCCDDGFLRRDLCVQYGETTYAFCRRLMAEEGLAYFYDHGGSVEDLIVAEEEGFDRIGAPVTIAASPGMDGDRESVLGLSRSVRRGSSDSPEITGRGDVLAFAAGRITELAAWAPGALLLTRTRHVADLPEPETTGESRPTRYENSFTGVPGKNSFRPLAIAKPIALGDWGVVASALPGDPIDADAQGQVRVRFLYDRREDVAADQRSPRIPVSQAWVGDAYGAQILPRAGMLVRIEYLCRDPDRPVIAGCFPEGRNVLPAPVPEQKARLTIRTHSLRDGARDDTRWNELALDDAAEN
jgi:type VI secretion system secreted protein VgrG